MVSNFMKKKFISLLLILFCFYLNGCKVILNPVQDKRDSKNYLRLNAKQSITQKLPDIKFDLSGIVLLISGKCGGLKLSLASDPDFKNIIEEKYIPKFSGNIRKTSIFYFKNTGKIRGKLWFRLYINNGNLLLGYKSGKINSKYNNTLTKNNKNIDGALYFKSIYDMGIVAVSKAIIKKMSDKSTINFFI